MVQRHNLSRADHVITHSDYSREELVALGFEPDRVSVIPLPPSANVVIQGSPDRFRIGPVELLYVGRFVRSKGVLDLLAAVESLARTTARPFRLTLAGNPALSSAAVLDEVRRRCEGDLSGVARLVLAPDGGALAALYGKSDIFVMPSYHEGYCVPVVEALASGCHVVAYDSSNLPFVLSGLGSLVSTGDVAMLTATLHESIERFSTARATRMPVKLPTSRGDLDEAVWRKAVRTHLESCSKSEFEAGWRAVLETVIQGRAKLVQAGAR
jgi:glycosyltransferase involved in cell wall biosynthesis